MYKNVHSNTVYNTKTWKALKFTRKETIRSWYSHIMDSSDDENYKHQHE